MISTDEIKKQIGAYKDEIIGFRRHLHMHPETGFDTQDTEAFIKEFLLTEGIDILDSPIGVIAKVPAGENKQPGYTALRADIDALPLEEENDVPYKSQVTGKMHACGHDGHTSMLMGAAHVLNKNKKALSRDVLLIFQPAEEGPRLGGARIMLKYLESVGLAKNICAIAALHLTTEYPCGSIAIGYGSMMASTDEFDITITGIGGHVGSPHKAIDALSISAKFITEMESFMSRRMDPFDPAVFAIGTLQAGTARNIIPEKAFITGNLRCQREETRNFVLSNAENLLKALCGYSGSAYVMDVRRGLPVLVNDDDKTKQMQCFAEEVVGSANIFFLPHSNMGAEDFAYFSEKIPAVFTWIGAGNKEKGFTNFLHNPRFNFDENALMIGATLLCKTACEMR